MRDLTWIFDLDNTLHDARPHIFPHINRSMTAYLREHLALDETEASALRERYWHRYGATLLGLMRHHGTDPHHFLWHTHQFPQLARMVVADRASLAALRGLRGRKVVFSNAPAHYVDAVVDHLGLTRWFDAVFAIEHVRFRPKPQLQAFRILLRSARLVPERCVMVDDTLANLRAAKRLGLRTVWVADALGCPPYVDACVRSVREIVRLADNLGRLRQRDVRGQALTPRKAFR